MHFKSDSYRMSLPFSVGGDTDLGWAVVGVHTNHLALRQVEMHPIKQKEGLILTGAFMSGKY